MPGLQDVRVTLYDIFGYLLPGLVAFGALSLFVWAAFLPRHPLHEPKLGAAIWIALLTVSYVLGHLLQAVALLFLKQREGGVLADLSGDFPNRVLRRTGADTAHRAYLVSDALLAQKGNTADREIYQYREGFYRGIAAGLALVLVALVVRGIRAGGALGSGGATHLISNWVYVFTGLVVFAAMLLAYHRYRRFSEYKISNAFICLLIEAGELPRPDSG